MTTLEHDLARLLPDGAVAAPADEHLSDLLGRGLRGRADAVCFPSTTEEVARVVAWCYDHDVPITPRGGGTGLAGGAIPDGGVVLALERLNRVRSFEPLLWRMEVEAGVTTGTIHRLARENGLRFPPDPGAWELSDRQQHRVQRRRAARVQVRRHRPVGDGNRGGRAARGGDVGRRSDPEGRRRLR